MRMAQKRRSTDFQKLEPSAKSAKRSAGPVSGDGFVPFVTEASKGAFVGRSFPRKRSSAPGVSWSPSPLQLKRFTSWHGVRSWIKPLK